MPGHEIDDTVPEPCMNGVVFPVPGVPGNLVARAARCGSFGDGTLPGGMGKILRSRTITAPAEGGDCAGPRDAG